MAIYDITFAAQMVQSDRSAGTAGGAIADITFTTRPVTAARAAGAPGGGLHGISFDGPNVITWAGGSGGGFNYRPDTPLT
jgi:hypothetical protein